MPAGSAGLTDSTRSLQEGVFSYTGQAAQKLDEIDYTQGHISDSESVSGNGTVIALLKNLRTRITTLATTLSDRSQRTRISSATADAAVQSTTPVGTEVGLVVRTIPSGTQDVNTELTTKDYDSGAGLDSIAAVGILLPKSGGAVAGGTSVDPIRTDPTGSTTQPVSASSLPLPSGAAAEVTLALVLEKLIDIFGAVDGLEVTAGNIDMSNTTIGLNVDEVEAILRSIRDNEIVEDAALLAKVEAVRLLLESPLAVTGTFWQTTQPVSADNLDIRDLALVKDNVRQTARPMAPFHAEISAGDSDQILVTAPDRIRVLRIDGGCKPSTDEGVFPSYTINLDVGNGDEIIRGKELQAGEPLGCTVCYEGVAGADLTVAVTGAGGIVEFDIAYEIFQ